jgi:RNA polymerase sigma-70 factor (ECF subfamily)
METSSQLPQLFRTEYRKIISVLCRTFGLKDVETAEDIASETFLTAAQSWGIEGLPPNPTAWLYTVARNKAINHLKRLRSFSQQVTPGYAQHQELACSPAVIDEEPSEALFEDSQLRLMFALCHPAIPGEMQVALCLRLLCGFGISEISDAFLTGKETITKRLLRAKERLREVNATMEMPPREQLAARLDSVLTTIYLLFNEGYYAREDHGVIRRDLCLEAVRLGSMLIEHEATGKPQSHALMALMCFHFSRFDSRVGETGEVVLYDDQDTSAWNAEWISKGGYFLQRAASGDSVTPFHLEAAIAYHHTEQGPAKWPRILSMYDQLLLIKPSPIVAMNRAYAVFKVSGAAAALQSLEGVELDDSHLYHALLGELWTTLDPQQARYHLERALSLAPSLVVRKALQRKLDAPEL